MFKKLFYISIFIACFTHAFALAPTVPLQVWTNEAIVNLYDFTAGNWLARQKDMAQYFTAEAWMAYQAALKKTQLIQQVTENSFSVSAVSTAPPTVKSIDATSWDAKMPVLVQFKNQNGVQFQNFEVNLKIIKVNDSGLRGFAIQQYDSKVLKELCACTQPYQPKVSIA
jgi:hypothetical protein